MFNYRQRISTPFARMMGHSGIYALGLGAGPLLNLLLLPILTRLLSESDYGRFAIFTAATTILVVPFSLNLTAAVGRYALDAPSDMKEFLGTNVLLLLAVFLGLLPLYFLFFPQLSALMLLDPSMKYAVLCNVLGSIALQFYTGILSGFRKSIEFSAYSTFTKGLVFVAGCTALFWNRSLEGVLLGQSIGWMLVFLYTAVRLHSQMRWEWHPAHARYIIHFSLPLLPYILSGFALTQLDRILIGSSVSVVATARYNVAATIGSMFSLVLTAVHTSSTVDQIRLLNEKRIGEYHTFMLNSNLLQLALASPLLLYSEDVLTLIAGKDYAAGGAILFPLIWGQVFFAYRNIQSTALTFYRSTGWFSVLSVVAGLVSIALNKYLLPKYGYAASAYVFCISNLVYYAGTWATARYVLGFDTVSNRLLLAQAVPLAVLTLSIPMVQVEVGWSLPWVLSVLIRALLGVATAALIYFITQRIKLRPNVRPAS